MKHRGLLMLALTVLTSALAVDSSRASQTDCWRTTQPGATEAEILHCLRVGHWVEVRGQLRPDGVFAAERIELQRPRTVASVWGVAQPGTRVGGLRVLGREVEISNRTAWKGGESGSFLGGRVRVRARRGVSGKLVAQEVELREPGVERISGRVDAIRALGTSRAQLEILGFEVSLQEGVRQRIEGSGGDSQRSPPQSLSSPASMVVDDDDLFGNGFRLHPSLHLGLQQDISFNSRRNFELDDRSDRSDRDPDDRDDRDDTSHVLRGQLTFSPNPKVTALVDARHRLRRRDLPSRDAETDSETRLAEAFVLVRDAGFGLDLQLGRQDYDEPREWLYDQNLDGVRVFRDTRRLHFELSASTTLSDGSTRDEDANNTIFYVSNRAGERHFAGYVVHRDFGSQRGERQSHVGLRALGPWSETLRGWAELCYLDGRRGERPVGAWGVDLGLTWQSRNARRWTFTAALAQGSGDRGGATDRRFRQTGLQDNEARIGGVTAVRYYGELFDPELSNLRISTLSIGARFLRKSSIELIGHTYRQVVASTRLTNTNLDQRPLGTDRDLGWELDLIVGVRRFDAWSIELVGSHFSQGSAFPDGDNATMARAQIRYRY